MFAGRVARVRHTVSDFTADMLPEERVPVDTLYRVVYQLAAAVSSKLTPKNMVDSPNPKTEAEFVESDAETETTPAPYAVGLLLMCREREGERARRRGPEYLRLPAKMLPPAYLWMTCTQSWYCMRSR